MQITFHGAAQTVTGSRHLLGLNGQQLLLDCGLFQGRRKDTYARNLTLPFEAAAVEAVVLSHAHIDHCGNLPNLVRNGFAGSIHATQATIHLTDLLTQEVDYLVMECTYGDRSHESSDEAFHSLRQLVQRTAARGGKVIIPSFALGRAQTLVYFLHQMVDAGDLPQIPMFVDSPLAVSVTDVFRKHPECFDPETRAFLEKDPHGTAFGFDQLTYTRSVEESKALNELEGPAGVISASGMAEPGRILHHLRNHIGDPRNSVLITSWMAPHTLGRRLAEGQKRVSIFGEEYPVQAEVASLDGLSAHGGQPFLLEYAGALKGRVKRIFLVHGEPGPAAVLQEKLEAEGFAVSYPQQGDSFEL